MPVLFHLSPKRGGLYGMIDKPGLPDIEEVLREFPDTIFIEYAPSFWNEIDGNLKASASPYAKFELGIFQKIRIEDQIVILFVSFEIAIYCNTLYLT